MILRHCSEQSQLVVQRHFANRTCSSSSWDRVMSESEVEMRVDVEATPSNFLPKKFRYFQSRTLIKDVDASEKIDLEAPSSSERSLKNAKKKYEENEKQLDEGEEDGGFEDQLDSPYDGEVDEVNEDNEEKVKRDTSNMAVDFINMGCNKPEATHMRRHSFSSPSSTSDREDDAAWSPHVNPAEQAVGLLKSGPPNKRSGSSDAIARVLRDDRGQDNGLMHCVNPMEYSYPMLVAKMRQSTMVEHNQHPHPDMFPSHISMLTGAPLALGESSIISRALACSSVPKRNRGEKKPIPDNEKDVKYFERRKRNNLAAKKSRDARKNREDDVARRADYLEKEYSMLLAQVATLRDEANSLKHLLKQKRLLRRSGRHHHYQPEC